MPLVNRIEFSEIIGCSPTWVSRYIKKGMPSEGGGRGAPVIIDTVAAIAWLISYEVSKNIGGISDDADGPVHGTQDGEDLLLTMAKRRKAEVEARKAEESVIDLQELAQWLYAIGTLYGNELDALGARLVSDLAVGHEASRIKNNIDAETRRVRIATAERIVNFVDEYRRKHGINDNSPANSKCSTMGE